MDQSQESSAVEELPRCQTASRISPRLEARIAALSSSQESIPIVINLNNGKIIGEERKRADEIIKERHPNLIKYLLENKIPFKFLRGTGQIITEVNLPQYLGLSQVNHGEVVSLDYSGNRLNDYLGLSI